MEKQELVKMKSEIDWCIGFCDDHARLIQKLNFLSVELKRAILENESETNGH